ncbi:myosin-11-like isoform X2 [Physella acuta]|uniref:myosin-11-like isoform X2 n=1 Tax=Physella acuta TaxID=109671 RepID=UPI0027DB7CFF|nr:myosin-11-like isoform X2 [Physella acuta]
MMWTLTVDSNVPIQTPDHSFVCESHLGTVDMRSDVDELLSSPSPARPHTPTAASRLPPSGRLARSLSSRSASPSYRQKQILRGEEEWRKALEKAVDEPVIDWSDFLPEQENEKYHNSSLDAGMSSPAAYDNRLKNIPLKALHTHPDAESGNSNSFNTSGVQDMKSSLPSRLSRSSSMSRLNRHSAGDLPPHLGSRSFLSGSTNSEKSAQELQTALDESESRRNTLMHKLKEAQTTLDLQNERLGKIESAAKENNAMVEDLKFKEREYRKKINQLESAEEEKQKLKMENLRLREEMQDRISALDFQLKSLKSQHHSTESDNDKRVHLLNHTTTILSLLEEENTKLQQDKEKLQSENALMKEAFGMTKTRFGTLDNDNRNLTNECIRLKEDNTVLSRKVQEMAGQMMELRSLLQAVRDENERLSSTWRHSTEDKVQAAKQVESYKDMLTDLKARLSATSADRDRLFQEKLEMSSRIQQMVLEKEQLMRAKLSLEDQIGAQQIRYSPHKHRKQNVDNGDLNAELTSVKKVCEELTSELSSVKVSYERALEQVSVLERSKAIWQSQQELLNQERLRLQSELDRSTQVKNGKSSDESKDRNFQDEIIQRLRAELKQVKYERNNIESRVHELETKLARANEGLREESLFQYSELDTWKSTCERLTSTVNRKESELQNLTDRCHEMEDMVTNLRHELHIFKDKSKVLSFKEEEAERIKAENRRLLQEKAENEQMIKLLETQKSVLAKNSEDGIHKFREVGNQSSHVDKLKDENETLRRRIKELEIVRDNLVQQKEQMLNKTGFLSNNVGFLSSSLGLEELEKKNKELKETNESLSYKLNLANQENKRIKKTLSSPSSKNEAERLKEENLKLQDELNRIKQDFENVSSKQEKPDMVKLQKEKDAVQKQVTLLQGQIHLMEGSKKRADEEIKQLNSELDEVRSKYIQVNNEKGLRNLFGEDHVREIQELKRQLEKSEEIQKNQEQVIHNLKQEQKVDGNTEVADLKKNIQELQNEVDRKERSIEKLERELKSTKELSESKDIELRNLYKTAEEIEADNKALRKDVQEIRNTLAAELAQEQQALKQPKVEKSLQEELFEAVKNKQEGNVVIRRGSNPFRSKSIHSLQRPASAPPTPSDEVPEKTTTDGSTRLQSLISKYRNHSDAGEQEEASATPKPIPGLIPSKIIYKNRFGITAPKSSPQTSADASTSESASAEKPEETLNSSSQLTPRPVKKLMPPALLPKPASLTSSGTKSSFMRTISGESKEPTTKAPSPLMSLRSSSTSSLKSSGLGQSLGNTEGLNDSLEQKDINALIQKEIKDKFDEMASF